MTQRTKNRIHKIWAARWQWKKLLEKYVIVVNSNSFCFKFTPNFFSWIKHMGQGLQYAMCVPCENSFLWASTMWKVGNKQKICKTSHVVVEFRTFWRALWRCQHIQCLRGIKRSMWTGFWVLGALTDHHCEQCLSGGWNFKLHNYVLAGHNKHIITMPMDRTIQHQSLVARKTFDFAKIFQSIIFSASVSWELKIEVQNYFLCSKHLEKYPNW